MNKKARQKQLLDYLGSVAEVSIHELVRLSGSSIATIRRDLLELHEQGKLIRTPGGARSGAPQQSLVQRTFDQRRSHNAEAKLAIAAAAAGLVTPGMTIVIDSGTTCWQFAAQLVHVAPLRVLTSAVAVIEALGDSPEIELIVLGGRFRKENLDFIGAATAAQLEQYAPDLAFLGCDGYLPGKGIYTDDVESHAISRAIARCAARRVVLFDHQKVGQRRFCRILAPREIDCIVTDAKLDPAPEPPCEYILAE